MRKSCRLLTEMNTFPLRGFQLSSTRLASQVGESSAGEVRSVPAATVAVFRKQAEKLLAGEKNPNGQFVSS